MRISKKGSAPERGRSFFILFRIIETGCRQRRVGLSDFRFFRHLRRFHGGAPGAGAAAAADAAVGAIAAAGALPRFFVADHTADQKTDRQRDDGDKNDVDEIGRKPCKHKKHFLTRGAAAPGGEEVATPRGAAAWKGSDYFTVSFCASL